MSPARPRPVLGTVPLHRREDRSIELDKLSQHLGELDAIGVGDVLVHVRAPVSYPAAQDTYGEIVTAFNEATV